MIRYLRTRNSFGDHFQCIAIDRNTRQMIEMQRQIHIIDIVEETEEGKNFL